MFEVPEWADGDSGGVVAALNGVPRREEGAVEGGRETDTLEERPYVHVRRPLPEGCGSGCTSSSLARACFRVVRAERGGRPCIGTEAAG